MSAYTGSLAQAGVLMAQARLLPLGMSRRVSRNGLVGRDLVHLVMLQRRHRTMAANTLAMGINRALGHLQRVLPEDCSFELSLASSLVIYQVF
jgi:hypothetical protein